MTMILTKSPPMSPFEKRMPLDLKNFFQSEPAFTININFIDVFDKYFIEY